MTDPVIDFYDNLSPFYKENMGWDWVAGMKQEADVLTRFLNRRMKSEGLYKLLDCTCGTGTQAIGLALHGHTVHATDLSPGSSNWMKLFPILSTSFCLAIIQSPIVLKMEIFLRRSAA